LHDGDLPVILAHHGYGEELLFYAAAGGVGAVPLMLAIARARLTLLRRKLRRH
jgi:hypothetical protein